MENFKKVAQNGKKIEQNELSLVKKATLFFMDLFKKPSKTGQRRLVKNMSTGKYEWTEGESPFETTVESLDSHKINYEPKGGDLSYEKHKNKYMLMPYEPLVSNRWSFSFPGLAPWFIQSIYSITDTESTIEVLMVINDELHNTLSHYEEISKNDVKRKLKKDATLSILDATGVTVLSYLYKNVEILNVDSLSSLSYNSDNLLTCKIRFKHEKRVKI